MEAFHKLFVTRGRKVLNSGGAAPEEAGLAKHVFMVEGEDYSKFE